MLHAAEALLFCRSNKFAVADERSRGIAVEGVKPQNDHTRTTELVALIHLYISVSNLQEYNPYVNKWEISLRRFDRPRFWHTNIGSRNDDVDTGLGLCWT